MQSCESADVVIAGAGCAGLSLAVHLVQAGITNRRIVLLDPRTHYQRDRTWCFWDVGGATPFDDAITHSWKQWRVISAGGEEIVRRSERFVYRHLPADRFYDTARKILKGFPNVELRLNCFVDSVLDEGRCVRVRTSRGDISAPVVFDSRPPRYDKAAGALPTKNTGSAPLLQHFLGIKVRADCDVFDATTATLMDFRVPQDKGIHFLYLLPFSAREALLESTFISPYPLTRAEYLSSLHDYCAARYPNVSFTFLAEEAGVIPMGFETTLPHPTSQRVLMAGIAGGMAKPSTGYAFLAIQRWSERVARDMAQGAEIPSPPAPRSHRAALTDQIFLAYLRQHPEEAPALFARLFRSTPADNLLRFLGDAGSIFDDIKVIQSLPKTVFLKQAWHEILSPGFSSLALFATRWRHTA